METRENVRNEDDSNRQLTLFDTIKMDFQTNQQMQKQIKEEIVIY